MKIFVTSCTVTLLLLAVGRWAHAQTTTGWMEYPLNPVYAPGKAYYPSILKEGNTYRMWSDNASGVQMAISSNGVNWTTVGQASGLLNPRHTVVEKIGTKYRMWYDEGSDAHLYSIEAIRTATSSDGLIWVNDQPITQVGNTVITGIYPNWNRGSYGPGDVIYNPSGSNEITVPVDESSVWANKFVAYYMGTTGVNHESIGLAVSNDGINWHGYNGGASPVLAGTGNDPDWDWERVGYPTVIKENDDTYHMWYCGGYWNGDSGVGHGIGYAFSTDGINWSRDSANPIFHKDDGVGWRDRRTYTPMVIGDQMWFSGKDADTGVYAIGYATALLPCTPVSLYSLGADSLLIQLGNAVNFEATIADGCGQIDALWDFEDGNYDSQSDVKVPIITSAHTYAMAGVYTVVLMVSDDIVDVGGNIVVVVYDPTGGFVTGGGTIWSEAGDYELDPRFEGQANFGFVAKYKKGANFPDGNTNFMFSTANMHFHSSDYDWLVVAGDTAKFKGTGTINGSGEYKFMLWAGDSDPDTFRILIWEGTEEKPEVLVYDNGPNDPITGGNIIIHKEKDQS